MTDDRLDREPIRERADMFAPDPKYAHTPGEEISVTELVYTMRETEEVVREAVDDDDSSVTPNFALGFWVAMASIRHDFAIEDGLWVDVEDDDV